MLQSSGNAWQLYINKPYIKLLGITQEEYTVLIEANDKVLSVRNILNSELDEYKNFLCKKLIKRGSSYGLNLDISLLELLEINPEVDEVDFNIKGRTLYIKKG